MHHSQRLYQAKHVAASQTDGCKVLFSQETAPREK